MGRRDGPRPPGSADDGQPLDEKGRRICGAAKRGGGVCGNGAGWGTDHSDHGACKMHYGNTPMVATGAFRRMAKAMGDPVETHPAEAMAGTIRATAGHVAWLETKVGQFRFVEQTKLDSDGVETEQYMTPNQERWWKIYQEERDRLVRYCEVALRAGLAERTVRLAEQQGEQMALAVDRILTGLALTDEQLARVPDVVPAALRSITVIEGSIE